MKLAELYVDIRTDSTAYHAAMTKVHEVGTRVHAGMERIAHAAKYMLVAMGGALALAMKEAVSAEASMHGLEMALMTAGYASDRFQPRLAALSQEIMHLTTYSHEEIEILMAQALNMGITADSMKDVVRATIGLAQVTGQDLRTSLRSVALAMNGNFMMLSRQVPLLRAAKDETEKMAIVNKLANAGWEQAKRQTETAGGAMKQIKLLVEDFAETVGTQLLPYLKQWLEAGRSVMEMLAGMSSGDIDRLIEQAKTLGIVLVGIWLAPSLLMGINGFITLMGSVSGAVAATANWMRGLKGASAMTGAGFSALAAGPIAVLVAALSYASYVAMKAKADMLAVAVESRTTGRIFRDSMEASKEFDKAETLDEKINAMQKLVQLRQAYLERLEAAGDTGTEDQKANARMLAERHSELVEANKKRLKELQEQKKNEDKMAQAGMATGTAGPEVLAGAPKAFTLPMNMSPLAAAAKEQKATVEARFVGLTEQWKNLSGGKSNHEKKVETLAEKQLKELQRIRAASGNGGIAVEE